MNFNKYYFNEENLEESPVSDIVDAGAKGIAKAAAKGIGRKIANVARGMTGRMKTIAFEPGWLKVLRPVDQKNYQKAINLYSNWRNKKTKLGPKQNFSVIDVRDGRLGEFSKDKFTDLLKRYDAKVPADDINMESEIQPRMTVYMLNNNGKIIFFDLPIGEDGKKRYYSIGLDNKAERAFTLIHGMRFEDFVMDPSEEAGSEEEKDKISDIKTIKKIPIEKRQYKDLAPKLAKDLALKLALAASYEYSNLFDLFTEEVLNEKAKNEKANAIINKEGKKAVFKTENGLWYTMLKNKTIAKFPHKNINTNELYAVDKDGNPDAKLQKELEKDAKDESQNQSNDEKSQDELKIQDYGKIYDSIKNEIDGKPEEAITVTKKTEDAEPGFRYALKNDRVLFLYQNRNNKKYYLAYNLKAEKIANELIKKFGLEKAPETTGESVLWDYLEKII